MWERRPGDGQAEGPTVTVRLSILVEDATTASRIIQCIPEDIVLNFLSENPWPPGGDNPHPPDLGQSEDTATEIDNEYHPSHTLLYVMALVPGMPAEDREAAEAHLRNGCEPCSAYFDEVTRGVPWLRTAPSTCD